MLRGSPGAQYGRQIFSGALSIDDVVVVVPGAIAAWRTEAVHKGGGYHSNTVAEDADLTMILLEQGLSVIYGAGLPKDDFYPRQFTTYGYGQS